MKWYENIAAELFEPDRSVTPGELIFFKFFECFVAAYVIHYMWDWAIYTQLRNSVVVLPLGIANYIDVSVFFDHYLAPALAAVTTLLTIAAFLRKGPRWLYLAVLVLFHLLYVIRFSQGEIPHSQNLIGMAVFSFAVGLMLFPGKERLPRFVLGSIIFFIGLGYTSAFFSKLIGTGWTWFDGSHLWLWIGEKSVDILSREGVHYLNWLQELALSSVAAASVILLIGWFTELIGFTMWWKKLRPWTTTLLIGMHIGITISMNIRFDAFVMQLILVGYPWHLIIDRFSPRPHWLEKYI